MTTRGPGAIPADLPLASPTGDVASLAVEPLSPATYAVTAAETPPPVVQLERVRKTYFSGAIAFEALRGIDLVINRGEFVAITGASGSGKSTLMNIVGCLDRPTEGRYLLDGEPTGDKGDAYLASVRNRKVGFIFQSFNLLPRASAVENVEMPLIYRGMRRRQRREAAKAALSRVGLGHRFGNSPSQLSGGEQQRVAIARALVGSPSLLLADEPTGNLDSTTTQEVLELFDELHREGRTILMITHEHDVAAHADRAVAMRDGTIIEYEVPAGV